MTVIPAPDGGAGPLDTSRAERLERLAQRRATTTPAPGTGSAPARQRPAPGRRRHPARRARAGALLLSLIASGGLSYLLAALNGAKVDAASASAALAGLPATVPDSPTTDATLAPSTTASPTTGRRRAATGPPLPGAGTTAKAATSIAATRGQASPTPTPSAPADTAVTGALVPTDYGPVQVQVRMAGGAISDVAVARYPDGDSKSVRINARALPKLRMAALAAQSAQIDTVSGATYTSDGYRASLQSAIDKARAAGATLR